MTDERNLQVITVNGNVYLGEINVTDGNVSVTDAITGIPSNINRPEFVRYCKERNLGKLVKVDFAGAGTTWSKTSLTYEQQLDFQVVLLNMQLAKTLAVRKLENRELNELLGKL